MIRVFRQVDIQYAEQRFVAEKQATDTDQDDGDARRFCIEPDHGAASSRWGAKALGQRQSNENAAIYTTWWDSIRSHFGKG